jgi:hypothetical protein
VLLVSATLGTCYAFSVNVLVVFIVLLVLLCLSCSWCCCARGVHHALGVVMFSLLAMLLVPHVLGVIVLLMFVMLLVLLCFQCLPCSWCYVFLVFIVLLMLVCLWCYYAPSVRHALGVVLLVLCALGARCALYACNSWFCCVFNACYAFGVLVFLLLLCSWCYDVLVVDCALGVVQLLVLVMFLVLLFYWCLLCSWCSLCSWCFRCFRYSLCSWCSQ